MASEADSSYNTSTTQESTQTHELTSAVWAHNHMALDGEDPAY